MWIIVGLGGAGFLCGLFNDTPFIGALLGLLVGWVQGLSKRVKQLEAAQQQLRVGSGYPQEQELPAPVAEPDPASNSAAASVVSAEAWLPEGSEESNASTALLLATEQEPASDSPPIPATSDTPQTLPPVPSVPPPPSPFSKLLTAGKDWLVGGNPFVRAGIVLLFIGVVFLLRYSLDKNLVPVEWRLAGAAGGALALLVFGWRLRTRQGAFGLILQAGGIGLLYLTVFGAFSLYQLLPSVLAFTLLVVIVAAGAMLAVLQNSLPLAMFATAGGFLAPLLTSSGSNNYIGLFSFYVILNAGIVAIAWFKAWRILNLLGFVFTFVIASAWGWFSYQADNYASVQPFLLLFFLFYVAIALLFAMRTPVSFKDKVDSTLVFGTPILGFGMQVALVRQFEYGVAISAVLLGAFYLLLAAGLWKRLGKAQQLLIETFIALGVIFTTLAIPFAVDGAMTSAAWAIEGAGVLWVSIRQQQWLRRSFAVFLQYAALVALLTDLFTAFLFSVEQGLPFVNGYFIAMLLVTGAMCVSSRLLSADFPGKRGFEVVLAALLLFTALLFLTLLFEQQIIVFDLLDDIMLWHLIYALLLMALLILASRFAEWRLLRFVLLLPLFLMLLAWWGGVATGAGSLLSHFGWLGWPLAFAGMYTILYRYQQRGWFSGWLAFMQVALLWLLTVVLTTELSLQMLAYFSPHSGWYAASLPVTALVTIAWVLYAKHWPKRDYAPLLLHYVALPLVGLLLLWLLLSLQFSGDSAPLLWIPVLNPLDLVMIWLGLTVMALYQHLRQRGLADYSSILRYTGSALAFVWLNMLVLRTLHHIYGMAWEFPALLAAPVTQTVLAIVWTLSGMALAWRGNRVANRNLWMAGAALLGMVIVKLFVVDFASSGTLARVISFLGVGVLLLFIGYLAPLPPAASTTGAIKHNKETDHV